MRQNLLLPTDHQNQNSFTTTSTTNNNNSSFASTTSTRNNNINNNAQRARKTLLELIHALELDNSNNSQHHHLPVGSSSSSVSASAVNSADTSFADQTHQPDDAAAEERRDKQDLLSFLNELDDDVVVEIKASHFEKEKENEERKFHFLNSRASKNQKTKNVVKKTDQNGDGEDDDENEKDEKSETQDEISYFDDKDQLVLVPNSNTNRKIEQRKVIANLRKELEKAQQSLENATQIGEEREVVIERMQQNLTRLTSLVEYFSSSPSTPVTNNLPDEHHHHAGASHHKKSKQQNDSFRNDDHEIAMLRSQLAVQEERIAHLTAALDERALREAALSREVDALRAGESVLKSELAYQQHALRGCSDELVVCQTSLFEAQEQLRKCDASRRQYVDAYNQLRQIAVADRKYTAQLHQQAKKMGQQLENSVMLEQVEEMLQLSGSSQFYYSPS